MATNRKLKIKLFIDKEKKKVICAESDKDFVDILFSFLTMPLGSIIRILDKQSSLGCMDKLYKSIESLEDCRFSTEACKEMLLRPLNASGLQCEDLIIRIDDSNPRTFFICEEFYEENVNFPYFSFIPKSRCARGHVMRSSWNSGKIDHRGSDGDGVFLRGIARFIISDDLIIMPASTINMQYVLERHGIKDLDNTEETSIDLDVTMLRVLLKRSLVSKFPLSDMYFNNTDIVENPEFRSKGPKIENSFAHEESRKVKAKMFLCKSNKRVLYAEAEGGFVNLLFSILTLPLGTIVELLHKFSLVGCLDNLYKSVENMSSDCKYFKPDVSDLLLHPKLAAHFGHSDSLFSVSEKTISTRDLPDCNKCLMSRTNCCPHRRKFVRAIELNPKLKKSSGEPGGNYAKVEPKFFITDQLEIKPFSMQCSIQSIKDRKASIAALEEKEIEIDEFGALKLLKSCLSSQTPLTDVFLPKKQRNRLLI